jgi:hypothetical protein
LGFFRPKKKKKKKKKKKFLHVFFFFFFFFFSVIRMFSYCDLKPISRRFGVFFLPFFREISVCPDVFFFCHSDTYKTQLYF